MFQESHNAVDDNTDSEDSQELSFEDTQSLSAGTAHSSSVRDRHFLTSKLNTGRTGSKAKRQLIPDTVDDDQQSVSSVTSNKRSKPDIQSVLEGRTHILKSLTEN